MRLSPRLRPARVASIISLLLAATAFAQTGMPTAPTMPDGGPTSQEPHVTFFPPIPPVYGAALTATAPLTSSTTVPFASGTAVLHINRVNGRAMEPPDDLADYVGEIFYPAVGNRLFNSGLSAKLEARLAAYRTKRAALVDALVATLAGEQNAPPAERAAALRAFAPQQAANLAELEAEAERLRRDLLKGGLFGDNIAWNFMRGWQLGDPNLAANPAKSDGEYQVARAAAFFQDGLSIEQRGLVRELGTELASAARSVRRRPAVPDDDPRAMFFAPETARYRLPQPLPPQLVALVGRFNAEKAALKRELHETLVKFDRASDGKRAARFSDLAGQQAARIEQLEKLAEEIRGALAALPTDAPSLPPIPTELRIRLDRHALDRTAFFAEMSAAMQRARQSAPMDWKKFFASTPAQRERLSRERQQRIQDAMAAATKEFTQQHLARSEDLRERYDRIRADLAAVARDLTDPRTKQPMTVDALLAAYHVSNQRFDAIGREEVIYERYRQAMLEPGLSPAQRRLLFRTAHAGLAQALPVPDVATSIQRSPRSPP